MMENEAEGSSLTPRKPADQRPRIPDYHSNSPGCRVTPCVSLSLFSPQNPVYNWSPKTQGIIFSSISYGTLIIQIPVGYLSEKYSIKKMIGSALLLSSLFSLILPMAAEGGEACIIACRAAQGVSQVLR